MSIIMICLCQFSTVFFLLTKQISMNKGHQVPKYSKQEPGSSKRSRKEEELVAPLHVQESCPEVPEVQGSSTTDMLNPDIASSIFGEDSASFTQSFSFSSSRSSSTWTRTQDSPCRTQQGLGDVSLRLGMTNFLRGGVFGGWGSRWSHSWHCRWVETNRGDIRMWGGEEVWKMGLKQGTKTHGKKETKWTAGGLKWKGAQWVQQMKRKRMYNRLELGKWQTGTLRWNGR